MPRVLAIIQTPVFGGPHNQMLNLVKPLSAQSWDTTVVLPSESDSGSERLAAAAIPLVQTPLHRLRAKLDPMTHLQMIGAFYPEVRLLEELIRRHRADVVQICGLMSVHGGVAARRLGVPIVWQLLSTFAPPPLRQILTHYVQGAADVVMTTGTTIAQVHRGILKLGDRVIPFYPPVDTERFRPDMEKRMSARAELGVPDDALLIGTVGNRNRQKGHDRMVEAFAHLQTRHSGLKFRILGAHTPSNDAFYQKAVVERARHLGLFENQQLQLVEPGPRVAELLPAFDIFVLTSRAEGIPTAVLEAMSCGVPVVSMEVGAIGEIVNDGKTGYLVRSTEPKRFAQTVSRLIEDSSLRRQMGEQSRRHAVAEFGIERCVALHVEAYEKALEHHR